MASASQHFCLKWNDFRSKVTSAFNDLRHDEELVDMTLCCDGQKIRVHRMMLSASSPYFKELLRDTQHHHPMVFLKDVSFADLSAVIEFVYRGEVNVSQQKLNSFLKTAEMLQVRGLTGEEDKVSESFQDAGEDTAWTAADESAAVSTPQPIFSPPYQQPRHQQQQRHLRPLEALPSRRPVHVAPATQSPVPLPPEVPPSRRPSQMALSSPSPTQLPVQPPAAGFKREPADEGDACVAEESSASGSSSTADGAAICRSPQQTKRPRTAISPALSLPASLGSPQPLAAPPHLVKQERPDYDEDDGGLQEQLASMASPLPAAAYSTGYQTAPGLPSPHQQRQRPFGAIQRPRLPNVTGAVSGSSSSPSATSSSDIPRPMQPDSLAVRPLDQRPLELHKKWVCGTCGRRYLEKAYLVSHEKMHSGETVCPVCSKVFSTKGNLTLHLHRVHKVQQQPIEEKVYIPKQRQQ